LEKVEILDEEAIKKKPALIPNLLETNCRNKEDKDLSMIINKAAT
jgi:hypothetical protein